MHRKIVLPKSISVIGLGKLGLPLALCWASRGFHVIGVDSNLRILKLFRRGENPYAEPLVDALLRRFRKRIMFTDDTEHAIQNSDATFIVVPTPSEADGHFSTRYVEDALKPIGRALSSKTSFHLACVVSTILPGSMERVVKPQLERTSGKKCRIDFGLCYNPEFIALGDVVRGILTPDLVLIGESDPFSGKLLTKMYDRLCKNTPPIARMSFNNAELAKISLNVYVTMKISFANTLAALCENLQGGNADVVSNAIGLDSRIGHKYLRGGLSYGGPCFPRDNRAFAYVAKGMGQQAKISEAADETNKDTIERVAQLVMHNLTNIEDSWVSILGLTYKPNTDVVEESGSLQLAELLLSQGVHLQVYDPIGMPNAKKVVGNRLTFSKSTEDCLDSTDLCIIATPWDEFRDLKPEVFVKSMRRPVVLDCWRLLDQEKFARHSSVTYLALGINYLRLS